MKTEENIIARRGNRHTLLLVGEASRRDNSYECRASNVFGETSSVFSTTYKTDKETEKASEKVTTVDERERSQDIGKKVKIPMDDLNGYREEKSVDTEDAEQERKVIEEDKPKAAASDDVGTKDQGSAEHFTAGSSDRVVFRLSHLLVLFLLFALH